MIQDLFYGWKSFTVFALTLGAKRPTYPYTNLSTYLAGGVISAIVVILVVETLFLEIIL